MRNNVRKSKMSCSTRAVNVIMSSRSVDSLRRERWWMVRRWWMEGRHWEEDWERLGNGFSARHSIPYISRVNYLKRFQNFFLSCVNPLFSHPSFASWLKLISLFFYNIYFVNLWAIWGLMVTWRWRLNTRVGGNAWK